MSKVVTKNTDKNIKILSILFAVFGSLSLIYLTFAGLPIFLMGGGPIWLLASLYLIPVAFITLSILINKKYISIWIISMILSLIVLILSLFGKLNLSLLNPNLYGILFGVITLYLFLKPQIRAHYFDNYKTVDYEKEILLAKKYRYIIRGLIYLFSLLTAYYVFTGGIDSLQYGTQKIIELITHIVFTLTAFITAVLINKSEKQIWIVLVSAVGALFLSSIYFARSIFSIIIRYPPTLYRHIDIITIILCSIILIFLLTTPIRKYYKITK